METLFNAIESSIRHKKIQEAFTQLAQLSAIWHEFLDANAEMLEQAAQMISPIDSRILIPALEQMGDGAIDQIAAYLFALQGNPEAITRSDLGFEKIRAAVFALASLVPAPHRLTDGELEEKFGKFQDLARGLLEVGVGMKEQAIEHLKTALPWALDLIVGNEFGSKDLEDVGTDFILLIKALEQKVGAPLLDLSRYENFSDHPTILLLAGKYNEALASLPLPKDDEDDMWAFEQNEWISDTRTASLILLGRYDEALQACEELSETLTPFVYFFKGEKEKALELAFRLRDDTPAAYIFLLMMAD